MIHVVANFTNTKRHQGRRSMNHARVHVITRKKEDFNDGSSAKAPPILDHTIPFVLITIAFILSHILQCSGQQS